jgi:hypothetical protein
MHASVRTRLAAWCERHSELLAQGSVADLGAYDINGGVKDIIPLAVGIDIVAGPSVDVVIASGEVPESLRGAFAAIVSTSAFQFSGDPAGFKREVVLLGRPGALVFVTMCSESCKVRHTTSPNALGLGDELRWSRDRLVRFLAPEISTLACIDDGNDLVFEGRIGSGRPS